MTQDLPVPATRRHAAVAAALSGAALVIVGYASGWGLSLPVAGSVVGAGTAPVAPPAVAAPAAAPPVVGVPVALTHHYVASGPTAAPTTPTTAPVQPTAPPTGPGVSGGPSGSGGSTGPTGSTGSPSGPGPGGGGSNGCTGLRPALTALVQHIDAGHLEESPSQQIADLLDLGQYTTTHTTLLGSLLQPLLGGVSTDLGVLLQHIDAGHLEASPAQQVQDLLSTDQYVKTHTVLIENLLKPLVGDRSC